MVKLERVAPFLTKTVITQGLHEFVPGFGHVFPYARNGCAEETLCSLTSILECMPTSEMVRENNLWIDGEKDQRRRYV